MAVVRMFCRLVKSLNVLQLFLLVCIAFVIYAIHVWKTANNFTTITKKIYSNGDPQMKPKHTESVDSSFQGPELDDKIYVIITFSKAKHNYLLQEKFKTCVSSMLYHTRTQIMFYIIGDETSQNLAETILNKVSKNNTFQVMHLDVDELAEKLNRTIFKMQKFFTKPGAYYSDPLFFLSLVIHRVMPLDLRRVIMLDSDLKFGSDINQMYQLFKEFQEQNVIGIAREMQPVYRHTFWQYRKNHPESRVGNPPPTGLTGFNSGVLLLDLDKMRRSQLYNSLIDTDAVYNLTEKYFFKGHLGDQDFFTLLSLEYENLFYILPCTWNRQLCEWWRNHGYAEVFDEYFTCKGQINIYHGNCNTPFPI